MIEVKELRRRFGPVVAVDGISFNAEKGEVLGLLGPNGAGKTTAMRIMACFLKPDGGTASVCGHDILKNPTLVKKSLGYLAENVPSYTEMTVGGFLNFVCDVREIRGKARKQALDRVVPACSIESVYHQTIDTLSKGYKRRVGLAQTLIHDPDVLRDRSALISLTACHNSHVPHDPNTPDPQILGCSNACQDRPRRR